MGRDSFNLTVEFPSRMFNEELGMKILHALHGKEVDDSYLDSFTKDENTGLTELEEYEAYEDDKVFDVLRAADIPFKAHRGRTWEYAAATYTYRPTYEPVDGGKTIYVEQSHDGDDFVQTNDLQALLENTKDTSSPLYKELAAIVRRHTTDPDNIVEKYVAETESGRNKPLMVQIDAVIKEMDAGNITNAEAMKQIAELKEKVKDNE